MAVDFTQDLLKNAALELTLLVSVLTALAFLGRKLWNVIKFGEKAFAVIVGTSETPSLTSRFDVLKDGQLAVIDRLGSVEAIALRSERELHPNGGGSMRDEVRESVKLGSELRQTAAEAKAAALRAVDRAEALAVRVEEVGGDLTRTAGAAKTAAADAKAAAERAVERAERLGDRLEQFSDEAHAERVDMQSDLVERMGQMRTEITAEMVDRTSTAAPPISTIKETS